MRFPGWFAIVVGAAMVVQWTLFLVSGNVPELRSEPIRLGFHLAAEFITAALLISSGIGVLRSQRWAKSLLLMALGMLLYTSIVSPGYFARRGELAFLGMFGIILTLASAAAASTVKSVLKAGKSVFRPMPPRYPEGPLIL